MKSPVKNKPLLLKMRETEIETLEKHVSAITDDLLIFDAYYANIQSANALLFEMCCEISKNKDHVVEIKPRNNTKGISFEFLLKTLFLDVVKYANIEDNNKRSGVNIEDKHIKMSIIKKLCDRIFINDKDESIELVFFINGINETLNNQRIEMLHNYFNKSRIKIKK